MQAEQLLRVGSYQLAPQTGQLWRGKQEVILTPKAATVLRYFLDHAGQVVTKNDLFAAAWPDTVVSDAALTTCIQELRQALHDNARKPRFIETVHRRGYRFLPAITAQPVPNPGSGVRSQNFKPTPNPQSLTPSFVGRTTELTQLHLWLDKALTGERQIVFVTGEPGIGKTMLVETFLFGVRSPKSHEESQKSKLSPSQSALRNPQPQISNVWVGGGQCIEHYGASEAYLPVLEALGRLCRGPDGAQLIALLRQYAPSWLVQIPALLNPAELEELQRRTAGVTRERMLRELAEALEVITAERPLVLILEDLHWSDVSTLDLLSMLARRQEIARLMIVGTYRPVEVLARDHPLKGVKQELQLHGRCEELVLDFLTEEDVAEYLAVRFNVPFLAEKAQDGGASHQEHDGQPPHPGSFDPSTSSGLRTGSLLQGEREPITDGAVQKLARIVRQRTDGNPLFMINVTNELVARGIVSQHNGRWTLQGKIEGDGIRVPENLRQLIAQQLARVNSDERKVLEAASVAGAEFSAAAVAAGMEQSLEVIETYCDALVRREQFLRAQGTGEWPDGTTAVRYSFVHALYQDVLYEQLSASRRLRLHRQIGEREEQGYGDRAREIAAELAVHFERGRDYRRAIQYLQHAGEKAVRRSAHQEAISLLSKGLELLNILPDTPERTQQELTLQIALGAPLMATKGFGATEVGQAYARARELCQLSGETAHLFPILRGLWEFYELRAEYQTAQELGEQLLALAQRQPDPALLLLAHNVLGDTLLHLGEFSGARAHLERAEGLYDVHQHRSHAFLYGYDSGVHCLSYAAWALWLLGYPEQALKKIHAALRLARELSHPFTFVLASHHVSLLHHLRREAQAVQERAEAEMALSTEQGFAVFLAGTSMYRGWALVEQGQGKEGIAQLHQALSAWQATGTEMHRPSFLALLAEAYGKVGEAEQGLAALVEALAQVEQTGERYSEAELYRLKGELLLAQEVKNQKAKGKSPKKLLVVSSQLSVPNAQIPTSKAHSEAEACFHKAIEVAQKQQAKSLELRAVMSLARLWQLQGKRNEAHQMLSEIYNWFTEGFDTKDLQEAKALLEELSH